ncbi:MAG: hypothetical protein LR001_00320 [Clostridiales bacterium]|nr:hypothetical protein [Clostridiales bacterium]
MDKDKFKCLERYFRGSIIELNDCAVTIELDGRMGTLKIPKRLLLAHSEYKVGIRVGFMMSYPEVLE